MRSREMTERLAEEMARLQARVEQLEAQIAHLTAPAEAGKPEKAKPARKAARKPAT